jgi:starvation-inducible DNA-binding protein
MHLNSIGLDAEKSLELAAQLNHLLSNFQIYYQNLRGIHWNVKGRSFFQLHDKFEELYTDANTKVDDLAERILTLGGEPLHTYADYLNNVKVPVGKGVSRDEDAVQLILDSLRELLLIERSLLPLAQEMGDEGTLTMITDTIGEQEKTVWMMKAWLSERV